MPVLAVIFNDKREILLTQRHSPKRMHLHRKWQFPGGGIEFGEHPRDTAIRETKEEVGIDIELLANHPIVYTHVFHAEPVQILMLAYPARYISGEINTKHDRQTMDAQWFAYEAIDWQQTMPDTKEVIDEAREIITKR